MAAAGSHLKLVRPRRCSLSAITSPSSLVTSKMSLSLPTPICSTQQHGAEECRRVLGEANACQAASVQTALLLLGLHHPPGAPRLRWTPC